MTEVEAIAAALAAVEARVSELEQVQSNHRALISHHESALRTVAQIMEASRGVDTPL